MNSASIYMLKKVTKAQNPLTKAQNYLLKRIEPVKSLF